MSAVPKHIRMHYLMDVRDFHFPHLPERRLVDTVSLMVRQGYKYRDPGRVSTWGAISGEAELRGIVLPQAAGASVEGISGVGKTQGCLRALMQFPQSVLHDSFPRLTGRLQQTVWLSVEVPASGKAIDLARALMQAWANATGSTRFDNWLSQTRIADGMRALDEWRQVAVSHFLGILHLDEVQNLFQLKSLRQRKSRQGKEDAPELSIVEDQVLRWLLHLTNSGQIPLLVSGTPDGIGALSRRLSTLQRLNGVGYHAFDPIVPGGPGLKLDTSFMGQLARYQFVRDPVVMDEGLLKLIVDLTGGVQRIVIALWVAAHRVAFEQRDDALRPEDFVTAASTWLAPLIPAVAALRSKDPQRLSKYEDLTVRDTAFWAAFWGGG
jgi:hypothetical protein